MKLLYCLDCGDVRKLDYFRTTCKCGHTYGRYHQDGLHAEIGGAGFLLGISNRSMAAAIDRYKQDKGNHGFDAFTIPSAAPTVIRKDDHEDP